MEPETTRKCNKCGITKDLSFFGPYTIRGKTHRRRRCSACRREEMNEHYRTHPEARKRRRETTQSKYLEKQYGLTLEQKKQMVKDRDHRCDICDKRLEGLKLNVDHCHTTGAVRGLLCNPCNLALGSFRDNVTSLSKAIDYLQPVTPAKTFVTWLAAQVAEMGERGPTAEEWQIMQKHLNVVYAPTV